MASRPLGSRSLAVEFKRRRVSKVGRNAGNAAIIELSRAAAGLFEKRDGYHQAFLQCVGRG